MATKRDLNRLPSLKGSASTIAPGAVLRDELEARGWTQGDLASVLGRPLQAVNQIINGRKQITPQTAVELSAALGTSPELWLNLESRYRLAKAEPVDPAISRRAQRLTRRAG